LQPDLFDLDDLAIEDLVLRDLADLLGASGTPLLMTVCRHARAMPQYTLGHLDRVAEIGRLAARHTRLHLAGNAFSGVGIPDCIRAGQEAAAAVLAGLGNAAARGAA